jgi:hypothetical protein
MIKIGVTLRKCILLLSNVRSDVHLLPRVLQYAHDLQLQLLLCSMTQSRGPENASEFVLSLDAAYRSLDIIYGHNSKSPIGLCNAEIELQKLRDTLGALSHALHLVPRLASAIGSVDDMNIPQDIVGLFVAETSEMLIRHDDRAANRGVCLEHLVSGMREELIRAATSIDASFAAAAIASANAESLSTLLENEKSARSAADTKCNLLQRECQNLKDELRRSMDTAAAAFSSSKTRIQLLESELAQLKVNAFFSIVTKLF